MTPKLWALALLSIATALYLGIFATKLMRADWGMALVWGGYSTANLGLFWVEWQT
ncbi:MAG: hypothetical protein H0W40_19530 [Methylibium sp.]|uniref:hypothetical protein n=1 Tax=Methylibium sp. TaxID=2067992 RepID=UPI00182EAF7A|nr:hypothetical protein [Methylibium sp.]MBA3599536.1 hypothetical protein [Methylibium sp.]